MTSNLAVLGIVIYRWIWPSLFCTMLHSALAPCPACRVATVVSTRATTS